MTSRSNNAALKTGFRLLAGPDVCYNKQIDCRHWQAAIHRRLAVPNVENSDLTRKTPHPADRGGVSRF
jgi:hypothetical protein